jgi:hypothetical protein
LGGLSWYIRNRWLIRNIRNCWLVRYWRKLRNIRKLWCNRFLWYFWYVRS